MNRGVLAVSRDELLLRLRTNANGLSQRALRSGGAAAHERAQASLTGFTRCTVLLLVSVRVVIIGGGTDQRRNALAVQHRVLSIHVGKVHALTGCRGIVHEAVGGVHIVRQQIAGIAKSTNRGVADHLCGAATLRNIGNSLPEGKLRLRARGGTPGTLGLTQRLRNLQQSRKQLGRILRAGVRLLAGTPRNQPRNIAVRTRRNIGQRGHLNVGVVVEHLLVILQTHKGQTT